MFIILLAILSSTDAVTLTGSSEYAFPGSDFTLTCDVPEEANDVTFYRRPDLSTTVGVIQVGGDQCYNAKATPPVLCTPDVCSCVTTSTGGLGTVFRWVIRPQTGDHGSVGFCRRTNMNLSNTSQDSPDYTLNVADGPETSIGLSPGDTSYTRTEGNTLPNITCTAECRPDCTFVWTKPDNTNFTASPVLSLGQLDRSEHGTYICTARNIFREATTSTKVTVQYGPGQTVKFMPGDEVIDTIENQTISHIRCSANCRPPCNYTWVKTGRYFENPLSFSEVVRGSAGQYTCTASNIVHQKTKTLELIVRFPPRILSLSYTQGDADVTENGLKALLCSVESYPPSTIQWYFKASNSVLLTTPDVLESSYALTTAGCLDTGLYTCSARNSVSNTAVTRDIHINVLCKPRLDERLDRVRVFGLATMDTLTMPAAFVSNPEPSFFWTFQTTSLAPVTQIGNGIDNFYINTRYDMMNVSAVSTGTRIDMQKDWFGVYNVTASNDQGSGTISFEAVAAGKPSFPYEGRVTCPYQDRAILSWKPAFDGGSSQVFLVGILTSQEQGFLVDETINLTDPGKNHQISVTVSGLNANTLHFFTVYAVNRFGNTTLEENVNCTTAEIPANGHSLLGPILGGIGAAVAITIVIIAVIVAKRRNHETFREDAGAEMVPTKKRSVDEDSTGLKPNVLYESAGPQPGSSSEYAVVQKPSKTKPVSPDAVYAEVVKSKNGKSETGKDVCAIGARPKQNGGAGKKTERKKKQKDSNGKGKVDHIYANTKEEGTSVLDAEPGPTRKKNEDGLIYLDVEFKDDKAKGMFTVTHGIENRTDYADVDFTKQAEPLTQE